MSCEARGSSETRFVLAHTYTCDEVFQTAVAICSLYALTGNEGAAAICVGAAIYGYNECLARMKNQH